MKSHKNSTQFIQFPLGCPTAGTQFCLHPEKLLLKIISNRCISFYTNAFYGCEKLGVQKKKKKNVQLMLLPGFDNYLFGFLDNCCGTAFSTCRACR